MTTNRAAPLASLGLALCLAAPAIGVTLDFPANAALQAEIQTPQGSHNIATGPWTENGIPMQSATGTVTRQAWKIDASGLTTLQMTAPLQEQLEAEGFTITYACEGEGCGGFDFRFGIEVMSPPDMFVDLVDYRYLSATRAEDGRAISLIASRTSRAGFVQVTSVGPPDAAPISSEATGGSLTSADRAAAPAGTVLISEGDVATQLETVGRAILPDLVFETGSAQLGEGDFPSLQDLADYLTANPTRIVALVGHTDSVGSLDANIALSKRRAGSVRERLVSAYSIPRRQLQAEGMGYLSPIASNLTEDGRDANRRVEVIMVSVE